MYREPRQFLANRFQKDNNGSSHGAVWALAFSDPGVACKLYWAMDATELEGPSLSTSQATSASNSTNAADAMIQARSQCFNPGLK
jgi:hypothetical protein